MIKIKKQVDMEKSWEKKFFSIITLILGIIPLSQAYAKVTNDPQAAQWAYEVADVYRAWDYNLGSSDVVVAIIDNGFDYTHPDFQNAVWINADEIQNNGIDDDNNGFIDDIHGWNFIDGNNNPLPNVAEISDTDLIHHGTVVAGIIGAVADNGIDGAGIAHNVKLMNLRVIDGVGNGLIKTVVEAVYYAVNNGADIINMSMVGSGVAPEIRKAIQYAYARGVVVVAAAGNNMNDLNTVPDFPVCSDAYDPYTSIIGVSAVGQSRRLASFSNIGSSCIDITAPGTNMAGPLRYAPNEGLNVSYSTGWNGTSFATPMVSATAALIKSIQSHWNPDQIIRTIFSTVWHTPANDERAYREVYGKGLLQVGSAVEAAKNGEVPQAPVFVEGDQDRSFIARRRLMVTGKTDGAYYEFLGENREIRNSIGIKDAEALTSFRDNNGTAYYAVIKPKNKTEKYISVYDYDWTRQYRWSFDSKGRVYDILALDITGDNNKEIVLVGTNAGKAEILAFYLDGTFIGNLAHEETHLGATATVRYDLSNNQDELIYAYRIKNDTVSVVLISKQESYKELFTQDLKSLGSIAYMQDPDTGEDVFVIGSDSGVAPLITTVSREGIFLHSFRPYDLSFRGGIKVIPVLYGEGGIERLAVVPKQGMYSLRIFNSVGGLLEDVNIDTVLRKGKTVLTTVAPF